MHQKEHQFIENHPGSTVFHTPEWAEAMEKTFGFKFYDVFSSGDNGEVKGYMPLYHVKSPITGTRLVSIPFNHNGGPVFSDVSVFEELMNMGKKLMIEVKGDGMVLTVPAELPHHEALDFESSYIRSILELSDGLDKVWDRFEKRGRGGVRKAEKNGVAVRFSDEHEDLHAFYRVFAKTRKKLGVPVYPFKLFENQKQALQDNFKLILAEYEGMVVASAIFLQYKNTLTYAYAGSLEEYNWVRPSSLVIWEAIKYACDEGLKKLDLGADHISQAGLLKFKQQWGVVQKPVYNYYMGEVPDLTPASHGFAREIWSMFPLGMTKFFGPRIIRHFG